GGLVAWPGGNAAYAAGLTFHEFLASRTTDSAASFGPLAEATAGRVPFTASRVFRRLYGASLGSLWQDYERALAASERGRASATMDVRPTRLTHRGNLVAAPRFAPPTCTGCRLEIVY